MTLMMPHQLLKPTLLLVLLFVVNLPSSWSLCDIIAARRDAYAGKCKKINPYNAKVTELCDRAADIADVVPDKVLEAYKNGCVKEDGYKACVLFSAYSNKCIGHTQHCVASLARRGEIEVECTKVDVVEPVFKSGGIMYISKEGNGLFSEVLVTDELNSTSSKHAGVVVPCLAPEEVTRNLDSSCISVVDPEKPGWYLRHLDGHFYVEAEYAPREPDTFADDASFILRNPDPSVRDFHALESVNAPNNFAAPSLSSNRLQLVELSGKDEREIFACLYVSKKEQFPCSSCDEILSLDSRAGSGNYFITSEDGKTLQEVHCETSTDEIPK